MTASAANGWSGWVARRPRRPSTQAVDPRRSSPRASAERRWRNHLAAARTARMESRRQPGRCRLRRRGCRLWTAGLLLAPRRRLATAGAAALAPRRARATRTAILWTSPALAAVGPSRTAGSVAGAARWQWGCRARCRRQPPGPSGCRPAPPTPESTARRPQWRKADWLSAAASGVGTQQRRAVFRGSGGASRTAPTGVGASAAASGNRDTGRTASGGATSRPAHVDEICDRMGGGGTGRAASAGGGASAAAAPGDDTGWAATGPIPTGSGLRAAGAGVDGDTGGGAAADVGHGRAFCWLPLAPRLVGACAEGSAAAAATRYARLPPLPALAAAPTMSCGMRRARRRPRGPWRRSAAVRVGMRLGVLRPPPTAAIFMPSPTPTAIGILGVPGEPPVLVV